MPIKTSTLHPFIIWTLQRTGGTNLTQRLTERSGLPGTQHEPFNHGRVFGHITDQWIKDGDQEKLECAVEEICQRGVIIKHCVETVPWEITAALARASCKAGYRHLFLYRRIALDRLLSLHFAQKTGVWGPDMLSFIAVTGAGEADPTATPGALGKQALAEAVPVEKVVNHEKFCVQTLTRTWQLLHAQGAQPHAMAYEDIYRAPDPEQPVRILLPVLQYLGLSSDEAADRAWVGELVGKGDQGTRDKYRDFPGVDELAKRIDEVAPFLPDSNVAHIEARVVIGHHPWIERCFIDVLPAQVAIGKEFELGGVVVLSQEAPGDLTLHLTGEREPVPVEWGLPSPKMASEHPRGANSAVARFMTRHAIVYDVDESIELRVSSLNSDDVVVAKLHMKGSLPEKRMAMDRADWEEHTHEEVEWWDKWLKTGGGRWPFDFQSRIDPQQPFPDLIEKSLLSRGFVRGTSLKVLDLGSGPLTYVGSKSENYVIEVVPVDPLADEYNALIDKNGVLAPNRTIKGEAEKLECLFPSGTFDVVWICNSLDHAYDPVLGFFQGYKALKIGGVLFLVFHPNEADVGDYQGLHNWNFDVREGNFIIESRGRLVNMSAILNRFANLKVPATMSSSSPKSKIVLEVHKTSEISLFDMLGN